MNDDRRADQQPGADDERLGSALGEAVAREADGPVEPPPVTGIAERAAARRGQVGSGDRSERIRTYNFPQGRVSDHRVNLTLYKLDKVLSGEALDEVIDPLMTADRAARLAEAE